MGKSLSFFDRMWVLKKRDQMYFRYLSFLLLLLTSLYAEGNVTATENTNVAEKEEVVLPSKEIHIEGIKAFGLSDLYDALSVEHASWFQFWKDEKPMIKDKLIPTLPAALQSFYDSEGYYDAKFEINETKDLVTVKIDEGEPVRVNDVNVTSDYDLSEIIKFTKGERFTAKKFIATKGKIIEALLKDGYCSYNLDSKAFVDLEKHTVDLRFVLQKGGVCTFGNVTVNGLKTIDPEIVKSRVRAEKGARFSTEAIQETSSAIYGLHSFDSVLINVDRKFYNVVPVDITVQEMHNPYHVEAGAGYDTYVGPRVHVKFTKHNFMGNAQQLSFAIMWSSLEQLARIDFYKPVMFDLFGFDVDFGTSIGYSNLEFDGFREKKAWTKAFMKHESERLKLISGLTMEVIEIDQLDEGVCVLPCDAYNTFLLAYPYIDITYDARDSKLNPKYGYYLSAYSEMGLPTDDASSLYLKTELEARGIYTVADLTMAIVGKIGAIDLESPDIGIPESKKFFAGGAYSNRAYGYREIGVIVSPTEDLINGALSMANLSLELDYPVWGDLYGAVFTDNTMLTDKSYDYTGDIITSAGAGVRYMTPVGPFKLDVAFNVNDPSIYGISFQIGQSF
jgi:translocation and assembly module TamA